MSSGSRSRSVLRRPPSGRSALIGNRPFRRLWAGSALSMAGTRTLGVCYPLLAFTLTESPTWTGWVMFAWTLPGLLCFLPAGVLADRVGHQRVMMWSEAIRGALVTTLCAGLLLGWLRVDVLLLIAFAEGGLSVVSAIAETALIPSVATPREMNTALAVHETTVHTVVLAGRPPASPLSTPRMTAPRSFVWLIANRSSSSPASVSVSWARASSTCSGPTYDAPISRDSS